MDKYKNPYDFHNTTSFEIILYCKNTILKRKWDVTTLQSSKSSNPPYVMRPGNSNTMANIPQDKP